jgi:hypothetical protein
VNRLNFAGVSAGLTDHLPLRQATGRNAQLQPPRWLNRVQQNVLWTNIDTTITKGALTLPEIHFRIACRSFKNDVLRANGNTIAAAGAFIGEKRFGNCTRRPDWLHGGAGPAPEQVTPG